MGVVMLRVSVEFVEIQNVMRLSLFQDCDIVTFRNLTMPGEGSTRGWYYGSVLHESSYHSGVAVQLPTFWVPLCWCLKRNAFSCLGVVSRYEQVLLNFASSGVNET